MFRDDLNAVVTDGRMFPYNILIAVY